MSISHAWSAGQRALWRFLEREGLAHDLPDAPPETEVSTDDFLFATIAELVPPSVLAELMATRMHLPLLETEGDVDPSARELLAAAVATRCGAVPVALRGETLEVATANPLDLDAVKTIEFVTGHRVRVRVATPETVRRLLTRLYGGDEPHAAVEAGTDDDGPLRIPPPRLPRLLVVVADPLGRDRLAGALHDAEPEWLIMTAQDASEANVLASLTCPDVVLVDASAPADDVCAGALAAVPRLIADDVGGPEVLLARIRSVIDTAQCG